MINKDYLKSLSPCEDRYKHYLEHYKNWSGTLDEFLDLPKLSCRDKRWVFFRSVNKKILHLTAINFAEPILNVYETRFPDDIRPRKAIEMAKSNNIDYNAEIAHCLARTSYKNADIDDRMAYAAARAAYATWAIPYAMNYAVFYGIVYASEVAEAAIDAGDEEKTQIETMKRYAREALKQIEGVKYE
jgi:hypothetical protein